MNKIRNYIIRLFDTESLSDAEAWKQLNLQWLQGYDHHSGKLPCILEEADFVILNNPMKNLIQIGGQIWFAEIHTTTHKKIIGTVGLLLHDTEWEINKLAVLPEFQGNGIGKMLIQTVIDFANNNGIKRLTLDSNSHLITAIRLYENFGFQHIPARGRYTRADIAMEKIL